MLNDVSIKNNVCWIGGVIKLPAGIIDSRWSLVQYKKIEKAIAYLKEQLQNGSQDGGSSSNNGQAGAQTDIQGDGTEYNVNGATGLDLDLLNDVLSDLEEIVNQTKT